MTTTLSLADSQAFFPYEVGDRWELAGHQTAANVDSSDYLSEMSVTGTKMVDGALVDVLTISGFMGAPGPAFDTTVQVDETGVWEPDGRDGPYHEVKFPLALCSKFQQLSSKATGEPGKIADVVSVVTTRGFESVVTPVGAFPDSLRVEKSVTMTYPSHPTAPFTTSTISWYAKGVGLVKRTFGFGDGTYDEALLGSMVGGVGRGVLPMGTLISEPVGPVSYNTLPSRPAVADGGGHLLMVTSRSTAPDTADLVGMIVSKDGTATKTFTIVPGLHAPVTVDAAFGGGSYLVVFQDADDALRGVEVSSDGAVMGEGFPIAPVVSSPPAVAFGGGVFLVVYDVPGPYPAGVDLHAARVASGSVMTGDIVVSSAPFSQQTPAVAFDGTNFLAVWRDGRDEGDSDGGDIYAARVTPAGQVLDPSGIAVSTMAGPATDPHVAFDGTRYIAAWFQSKGSSDAGDIHGARLSTDGALMDGPASAGGIVINASPRMKGRPHVATLGKGTLVSWEGYGQPDSGIFGTRLGEDGALLDGPVDGDGFLLSAQRSRNSTYRWPVVTAAGDRDLLVWIDDGQTRDTRAALLFPW